MFAAGAGDEADQRHRAASHRCTEQQLRQNRQELPGQGQNSLTNLHVTLQSINFKSLAATVLILIYGVFQSAAPHQWRAEDGRLIEMDTQHTIRARELKELYNNTNLSAVSQEERLQVLMTLKHTVKVPHTLTHTLKILHHKEK